MPVLVPLDPNWKRGVRIVYSFKTEIMVSRSGKEQRRADRISPRRRFEFTATVDKTKIALFNRFMVDQQNQDVYVAEYPKMVKGTTGIASNGTSLPFAVVPAWAVTGAKVALISGMRQALRTITTVVGSTVNFAESEVTSWPAGTKLAPARLGMIDQSTKARFRTNTTTEVPVAFAVRPGSEVITPAAAADTNYFDNRELFRWKLNWGDAPESNYEWPTEEIDFEYGVTQTVRPVAFASRTRMATFVMKTRAEAEAFVDFFCRMFGQLGEFRMPSWEPDIVPSAALVASDNKMTVAGTEFYDAYNGDTVHTAVMVTFKSGLTIFRKISGMAIVSGNTQLTFTADWPFSEPASNVKLVCWAPVCRFASDEIIVEWLTDSVAQVRLGIMSLEDRTSEDVGPTLSASTQWMIDTYGWEFSRDIFADPLDYEVNVHYPAVLGA